MWAEIAGWIVGGDCRVYCGRRLPGGLWVEIAGWIVGGDCRVVHAKSTGLILTKLHMLTEQQEEDQQQQRGALLEPAFATRRG